MVDVEAATRRSKRERKAPTPIYRVLDQRASAGDNDNDGDNQSTNGRDTDGVSSGADDSDESESESSSGDDDNDEEADARQFVSPKPKAPPLRPRKAAGGGNAKRNSNAVVRPRKLKPVQEERHRNPGKRKGSDASNSSSSSDDPSITRFFRAVKRGDASLPSLWTAWRDRFDDNNESATREVLEFLLQACGGDGPCVPTTEALATLDMSDLVDFVVEDLGKARDDAYPLVSRTKALKRFPTHFQAFWSAFVTECFESELLFTTTIVHQFVDWCSTLSSAEVRAVRHTATIAAFAIGHALVQCTQHVSHQLAVVTRQLLADANAVAAKRTPTNTPITKKTQLLHENQNLFAQRKQQLVQIVTILFNGVVVHRYRDVMPVIRAATASAIAHWTTSLPEELLKDKYVKYLGWLLNDKDASVRLQTITVLRDLLYADDAITEQLELFTTQFLPRFLQLCFDVSNAVVLAAVELLIAVDKRGLLLADVDLQPVEQLVLTPDNRAIRRAAAAFVCLQYDAFGVADSSSTTAANDTLQRAQRNTQAIALVELAEALIANHNAPPTCVETLVDAFYGLDDCQVLQDWRLLIDLLLADKSAPDLTTHQQSILLRLLVAAVRKIVADNDDTKKKAATATIRDLTVAFCQEIPQLLVRYQSDAEKLSLVVELIPMLSLHADVIGAYVRHVTTLLERLKQAFVGSADETLLVALAVALHHLVEAEHDVVQRETEVTLHEIVHDVLEHVQRALDDDARAFNSQTTNSDGTTTTDREFALQSALMRLTCLIRFVDVRAFVSALASSTEIDALQPSPLSRMDRVAASLTALIQRRTRNIVALEPALWHAETITYALLVLYVDVLWVTRVVFTDANAANDNSSNEETKGDDATDAAAAHRYPRAVRDHIVRVVQSRTALETCLVSVLEMHLEKTTTQHTDADNDNERQPPAEMEEIEFEHAGLRTYVRAAQRMAFFTFCDTRCLFIDKLEEAAAPFDALQWPLPRILVLLTQMYFENEMETVDDDDLEIETDADARSAATDEPQAQTTAAARRVSLEVHKAELLLALGKVSISNPSNRRQSAAVLRYFTEPGKHSVDVVRAFSRYVKHETPVRYLEVQMTALRQQFNSILALKDELEALGDGLNDDNNTDAMDDGDDDDQEMRQELRDGIESSEVQLKELAKKLSQSLGVGKIAATLRGPFFRFVCEGIRFALERQEHVLFLEALRPFLAHVDSTSMKQLRAYFMQLLSELQDASARLEDDDERRSADWRIVFEFQSAITTSVKRSERPQQPSKAVSASTAAPAASTATTTATNGQVPLNETVNADEQAPTVSRDDAAATKRTRKRSLELEPDSQTDDASARIDAANTTISQADAALSTPLKRVRPMPPVSEHKSDNDEDDDDDKAMAEETDASANDSSQSPAVVETPLGVRASHKRSIEDVEPSAPRRTTTKTTTTTTTCIVTSQSIAAIAREDVLVTDAETRALAIEADSRRARRHRRSLLTESQ